jgi:hypothetical protein
MRKSGRIKYLSHLGVNVVAGVAELCDLLGQEFHSLGRVAEDDALKHEQRFEKKKPRLRRTSSMVKLFSCKA